MQPRSRSRSRSLQFAQPISFRLFPVHKVYTLAKDIAPGKFIPTPTHAFIRLLHEKGRLHTCYTQNIDTLERLAGVPADKIVEAHGSFASQRCIECKTSYNNQKMKLAINEGRVPRCGEKKCNGLVKPDIVFFGESVSTASLFNFLSKTILAFGVYLSYQAIWRPQHRMSHVSIWCPFSPPSHIHLLSADRSQCLFPYPRGYAHAFFGHIVASSSFYHFSAGTPVSGTRDHHWNFPPGPPFCKAAGTRAS